MFQVLALPRSRTLWLSLLLDRGRVTCFHEGLSYFNSVLPPLPGQIVGSVDTCPLFYAPQSEYPVVVIESSVERSLASILANFDIPFGITATEFEMFMRKTLSHFNNILATINGDNVLRFSVDLLDDHARLQAMSHHLTPGFMLNKSRLDQYCDIVAKVKNRKIEPHINAVASRYNMTGIEYVLQVLEARRAS